MKKRTFLFVALIGLLANQEPLQSAEEEAGDLAVSTTPSDIYPEVTCTTSNGAVCADVLQMAADTRDQLGPLLKLGKDWRFPVHISVVTPDDPLAAKVHQEGVSVVAANKTMEITAVLPSSDPDARAFIQRQFVTALLWEKFFATSQSFDTHTQLDTIPFWLIEGLREWLNDDPEHDRESIVKRAVANHRAPTLDEVTSWQQLSNDRLVGRWQRAFSYYLVNSLLRKEDQRNNFQQWLTSISGRTPSSAKSLFPTEMGWQRELVEATGRSRAVVYTWDETAAELAATETIAIPSEKPKDTANTRICTLDSVITYPVTGNMLKALQQKIFDLTNLELRAHVSWQPVIALYRFGLSALTAKVPDPVQAKKFLDQARQRRIAEMDYHQKLLDYINWFEVTKDYSGNSSQFRTYFSTAEELEKTEANPNHPNPIRANLLQVESQL